MSQAIIPVEIVDETTLDNKTSRYLKECAQKLKIKGYSSMTRQQLLSAIKATQAHMKEQAAAVVKEGPFVPAIEEAAQKTFAPVDVKPAPEPVLPEPKQEVIPKDVHVENLKGALALAHKQKIELEKILQGVEAQFQNAREAITVAGGLGFLAGAVLVGIAAYLYWPSAKHVVEKSVEVVKELAESAE